MKTPSKSSILPVLILSFYLLCTSCIIKKPKPEECEVIDIKMVKISEGRVKDVLFHNEGDDKFYYINQGLGQGLNLDSLNAKVLNKTVTLHLAKTLGGSRTINHIAQLALDDEIIFTEFSSYA